MQNIKGKIESWILAAAGIILLLIFIFALANIPKQKSFGDSTFNRFTSSTTTNTSVNCPSVTSTQALVAAGGRQYGVFTNDSANNIYLCFKETCASSTGIRLNANGGVLELKYDNLYVGAISCVAATATSTLTETYSQ